MLLLLCASALRFGLVRTALVAATAKLGLEVAQEAVAKVRKPRRRADDQEDP